MQPKPHPNEIQSEQTAMRNTLHLPFRKKVFDTATDMQMRILVAARNAVLQQDSTQKQIANIAGSSQSYVTTALTKYVSRKDLPLAYTIANYCVGDKTYEDLTEYQAGIINTITSNPEMTYEQVADNVGCSPNYVGYVLRVFDDIVRDKNESSELIDTPVWGGDIPLHDLTVNHRSENPDDIADHIRPLLRPFNRNILTSLSVQDRFVLLMAREWAVRGELDTAEIADAANLWCPEKVEYVLGRFTHTSAKESVAATVAQMFLPEVSEGFVAANDMDIVHHFINNPSATLDSTAKTLGESQHRVWHLRGKYMSLINKERSEQDNNVASSVTP